MLEINKLYHGDCLELMKQIPDESIDLILCDLPYGTTARQEWDVMIPLDLLWESYNRIIKLKGNVILTAIEPFRTKLIISNIKNFRYDLIWEKNYSTGFLNANKQPLRKHESILVFYKKFGVFNPQKTSGHTPVHPCKRTDKSNTYGEVNSVYNEGGSTERFPTSILKINNINNNSDKRLHPSQKPIELMEYLIKSYSNENALILDNCMGSGTTCLAAKNLGRNYIGIDKNEDYCNISLKRLI